MRSRANTKVNTFAPIDQDEYGYTEDGGDSVLTNTPVSLIERRQIAANPQNNNQPAVTRWAVMRVDRRYAQFLGPDHRVIDLKSGITWIIEDVTRIDTPTTSMDARVQLRRAS